MPARRVAGAPLDFATLRGELSVPGDFSSTVVAEANRSARAVELPDEDASDIPLVTVDPAGSRDLDQALHVAHSSAGYVVSYAIADVASFVRPGSLLDEQAQMRGETLYFPDARVPLYPPQLSEDAASLLPGQLRPAVLWRIGLDRDGHPQSVDVRRARVRSRAQLDYAQLQQAIDRGSAPDAVAQLAHVGRLRLGLARARHAIDLDLPEQDVEGDAHHGWRLQLRDTLPVETYNAEISLLAGMCAASLMLEAGFGILRTVPPPSPGAVAALHRIAPALGVDWPRHAAPGDVLARVDRSDPRQFAFIDHAVSLLRGAGYVYFDGAAPDRPIHAGIGAPYAHVTAPLRRLVDRYGSEICLAISAKTPVPEWVRARAPTLPATMAEADRRAHEVDRAVVDATEAWLLSGRIGEVFDAIVLDADANAATVALDEPAVRARCSGAGLAIGSRIKARLVQADVASRTVRFESVVSPGLTASRD